MLKKILLIGLALFILIQFLRPVKNVSATVSSNGITNHIIVSGEVLTLLKRSCYDCHSNNTIYPWYFAVQPVAWWMQDHVNSGKRKLNFSDFYSYPVKKQYHKLKSIVSQIKKDEMPLESYLWIHKYAQLTEVEKIVMIKWADSLSLAIKAKNNLPDEPEKDEGGPESGGK